MMTVIEEEQYEIAKLIAEVAHKDQKRWNGDEYITHPIRVAESMHTYQLKTIAILHDVLEDSELTSTDLLVKGFEPAIVEALIALTRKENEDYFDFVLRCKKNKLATIIKIADLSDNLRDSKPGSLRDKYLLTKYILLKH